MPGKLQYTTDTVAVRLKQVAVFCMICRKLILQCTCILTAVSHVHAADPTQPAQMTLARGRDLTDRLSWFF